MNSQTIRRSCLLLSLVSMMLTSGCHKNNPASATEPQSKSTAMAMPGDSTAPLAVSAVTLGKSLRSDHRVTDAVGTFGTGDVVYASVETTGAAHGARLTARWIFDGPNGAQQVKEDSRTISPNNDAVTEFHVAKPGGWSAGSYHVEILLGDKPVTTKPFTVA